MTKAVAAINKGFALKDVILIVTVVASFAGNWALTNYRLTSIEKTLLTVNVLKEESIRNEAKLKHISDIESDVQLLGAQVKAMNSSLMAWVKIQEKVVFQSEMENWILRTENLNTGLNFPELRTLKR